MSDEKSVGFKMVDCLHVTMDGCESIGADVGFDITGAKTLTMSNNRHIDKGLHAKFQEINREINSSNLEKHLKEELLTKLNESLTASTKAESASKYASFISSAADHLTIIGTAWPLITSLGKIILS